MASTAAAPPPPAAEPQHEAPARKAEGGGPNASGRAIARALICSYFIISALSKIQSFERDTGGPAMTWFAPKLDRFLFKLRTGTGVDIRLDKALYPQVLLSYAVFEFAGAALFLSDIKFGALVLIGVLGAASIVLHNFWDFMHSPTTVQNELNHFLKNMAIMGGLLHYLVTSPGTRYKNKYEVYREQDQQAAWRRVTAERHAATMAAIAAGTAGTASTAGTAGTSAADPKDKDA